MSSSMIDELLLVTVTNRVAHAAYPRGDPPSSYLTECGRRLSGSAMEAGETNIPLCKACAGGLRGLELSVKHAVTRTRQALARAEQDASKLEAMLADPEIPE